MTTSEIIPDITEQTPVNTAEFLDFIERRTYNGNPILQFINDLRIASPMYEQYIRDTNSTISIAGLIANSELTDKDVIVINNYLKDKPLLCQR